jgi:hypothetical protein
MLAMIALTTMLAQGERADWAHFELGGLRPYAGFVFAGGPVVPAVASSSFQAGGVQGSFLFGLRAGVMSGTQEIGAEVSPVTFFYANDIKGPALQANATFGNYFRLSEHIHYPLRIGAGVMAINTPRDNVFFQLRGDLVGLAFQVGHLFFELHAPSFRYATDFGSGQTQHFFWWEFGASTTYVL